MICNINNGRSRPALAIILAVFPSVEHFMSAVDLGKAPLSRLFWRYVTPTVAAMLVTGILSP